MKTTITTFGLMMLAAGSVGRSQGQEAVPQSSSVEREQAIVEHADVPQYPFLARAAGLMDTVRLKVRVKDGVVVGIQPDSSAHPILENAAVKNVKTWQFGSSVNYAIVVEYIYELQGAGASLPQNPRVEMQLPTLVKITARPTNASCQDCQPSPSLSQPIKH